VNTLQDTLRIATYNIHKGVQGVGPRQRLEIHNLGHAIEQIDADIICLQEVRKVHRRQQHYFTHWPDLPQAEFLAPDGYEVAYRTNAVTRHGEHGNALLARWPLGDVGHRDVSDHPFEQRGLLHVPVLWQGTEVHVVVVHLGLMHGSRVRQVERLAEYIAAEVPGQAHVLVAGDFNDWGTRIQRTLHGIGMRSSDTVRCPTYPSRLPVVQLDQIFARGLKPLSLHVPRGRIWGRMSDHLPLIGEFGLG
jgi:endonuclease/exonuclease/phosphatase family metal-dependent hydrolase